MSNLKLLKTITAGFALAVAFFPQAFTCDEGYIVGIGTGSCIRASGSCGSGCSYTLDSQGNLNISGNGGIGKTAFQINKNIRDVVISEGITYISAGAFEFSSITSVKLPNTLRTIDYCAFQASNLHNIVIPEGVTSIDAYAFNGTGVSKVVIPSSVTTIIPSTAFGGTKYCTAEQKASGGVCSNLSNTLLYEKDGDNYIAYDANGKIDKIFGSWEDFSGNKDVISGSYAKKDENGNILATYSGNGVVLSEYSYEADGSVYIRDANGKLVGAKKTSPFTPAEAAALVKKGNHNTVTLTVK